MAYTLVYHPRVADDLERVGRQAQVRIRRAIEGRLAVDPLRYGVALTGTLRGHRKLRVADYRVVFRLLRSEIYVLAIAHRSDIYERVEPRLG